jgi:hypothetical protein
MEQEVVVLLYLVLLLPPFLHLGVLTTLLQLCLAAFRD